MVCLSVLYKVVLTFKSVYGIIVFKLVSSTSAFHCYVSGKFRFHLSSWTYILFGEKA